MAIVKHIKSRNANYPAAINYLLFEHDEKTGKKIVDESGRSILRKEFYMDGLNCDPMSFDKECELTNAHFHKNKKREDIKSHQDIIVSASYRIDIFFHDHFSAHNISHSYFQCGKLNICRK